MAVNVSVVTSNADREQCYAIRRAVFVDEQSVPVELELDEYDAHAVHFLLTEDGVPIGTARLLDKNGMAKVGRVALLKEVRGRGLGLTLMRAVLDEARARGFTTAMLDSQTYALAFYARLGFVAHGPEFDDAGIPHRRMTREL